MDLVITSSHATLSVFSRRHSVKVAAYLEMFGEIPRRHEARAYAMKFRRETRTWRERTTRSREKFVGADAVHHATQDNVFAFFAEVDAGVDNQ